ncbi:FeoB-associated Cys-rich membrane protein [Clostridium cellulovorans]|uniref:Virus attachment protein p12 family n=1 Tax=Clostridium cellulovorans (strain ATCC 35296 / DSM 3052 / OCM 3 / 743B) TaxID=573061 RepID=D9SRF6_CLOC7|nr:FeoB-associated Cys-rich membrane protein [Clostridium cellulovorans]ADL52385.1 hypothetical protein Clocel_2685 [Clostridium cellulovorans 743B]
MVELLFTGVIVAAASYILYKKTLSKKASSSGCGCSSCSSTCPKYNENPRK